MNEKEQKISFVKNILLNKIIEKNDDLRNLKFISAEVDLPPQFDGFMSAILTVNLKMKAKNGLLYEHPMVVKLMKGSKEFRLLSGSYTQFANEILVYSTVIPVLQEFLDKHEINTIDSKKWIPRVYYADYGSCPELSNDTESVLALQDLKSLEFRNGPKSQLNEEHLTMLINTIADYHSVQYAMKISNDPKFNDLKSKVIPSRYEELDGSSNIYSVLYNVAMDRFFEYYDRSSTLYNSKQLHKDVNILRQKFGKTPCKLLQKFRNNDPVFDVIFHGEYNRNNILFQYVDRYNCDKLKEIRMIDFQLSQYGSPAFDLTFLMYFNMNPDQYDELWDKLLDHYHQRLIDNITKILKISPTDKLLESFSKENFLKHFARFAFFGVMVTLQFLPWVMCSEEECAKLCSLFEQDMKSDEFYDFSMVFGGDQPKVKMVRAFQHASSKGYTDIFYD